MVPETNYITHDYDNYPPAPQAAYYDELDYLLPVHDPPPPPNPTTQSQLIIREIVETILLMIFIFWAVNTLTGRFRIEGSSMLPGLIEGEYVIVNKLSYYLNEPERGDVIVLHFPNDPNRDFIKRVIGLPGDTVIIQDQKVSVNGVILDEPYIFAATNGSGEWVVPANNYFVVGDNRNNSSDSRHGWFLPRENIVGRAWFIYWDPKAWRFAPHYSHPDLSNINTTAFLPPPIPLF
ncbi:MAG TPA: signal peptidase I [Anaerolineae bacterium]|nr:signal peptidase I [Anaerolineae bacterium]